MRILIADDDKESQVLLKLILEKQNYEVIPAADGDIAWDLFQKGDFRLVITDWLMPNMGGLELCEKIKKSDTSGYTYVIIVTAKESKEDLVRAMDTGADDYITKPYDKRELLARVRSGERILNLEQEISSKNQELSLEKEKSERLLLSIFPKAIADQLKQEKNIIADSYPEASILFAEIYDFANLTTQKNPIEIVELLSQVFTTFDKLTSRFGLEKIKTIGDTYMVVSGVPTPRKDHAEAIAEMAFAMQKEIVQINTGTGEPLQLCIGINSGPVVAGVIGTTKLAYDLWGETVHTAAQMKTYGLPGSIQITETTHELLRDIYIFEERGEFYLQGTGSVKTYLLEGRKSS